MKIKAPKAQENYPLLDYHCEPESAFVDEEWVKELYIPILNFMKVEDYVFDGTLKTDGFVILEDRFNVYTKKGLYNIHSDLNLLDSVFYKLFYYMNRLPKLNVDICPIKQELINLKIAKTYCSNFHLFEYISKVIKKYEGKI